MAQTLSFSGATTGKTVNLASNIWADTVRIMALGDSLTFGAANVNTTTATGYRSYLQQQMAQNGLRAEWVGPNQTGSTRMLDRDQAGIPGRTADQLLAQIPTYIATYQPGVILLLIGTNDVTQANAITTVPQEINQVLTAIKNASPNTEIFLAQLPPIPPTTALGPTATTNVNGINAALPNLVANAQAAGVNVTYVPMPNITTNDLLSDGVHLTETGYAKMAEYWYSTLLANLTTSTGTLGGTPNAVDSDTINVTGSEVGDSLTGDSAANIFDGRAGNDQITGAGGADTLTGGAGSDWFIYNAPTEGGDTITDFDTNADILAFNAAAFPGLFANTSVTLTQGTTASGAATQFIYSSASGQLWWDADGAGGAAQILIATITNRPTIGTDDFFILGDYVNEAPYIANPIADQRGAVGQFFSFTVPLTAIVDPDGEDLFYFTSLADGTLPAWLTFNEATRTYSGTPTSATTYTLYIEAWDSVNEAPVDSFTLQIRASNAAPVVANALLDRTATPSTAFSYQFATNTFTDANSDTLTYSAALSGGAALPSWLTFNASTRTFSGTPPAGSTGTLTVRVTANDGWGGSAFDEFLINLGPANTPPVVANPIADQNAPEDSAFSFIVPANAFTDANGDALTYTATLSSGAALPAWLSFNATTRAFSGTPAQANVGAITVRVTANDGKGGTVSDDFVITTANVNDAPTVATPIPNGAATEASLFSYTFPAGTFADQDGNTLTYSATLATGAALPGWLTFNATTRTFSGTPGQSDVGAVSVRVTANDGAGGTVFDDFTVTVAGINHAPTIAAPIADQSAPEDAAFSFTVPAGAFVDSDAGNTLTYTATLTSGAALPAWLSFNAATRTFTGTPLQANVGAITVRVTASDGLGGTVFDDFVITTTNLNDAPTIATPIPDRTATEASAFSYQVAAATFADQDGDTLTYSAALSSGAALPSWLSFNATTRTFSGTPGSGDVGPITVRVTANDGNGGSVFDDFVITTGGINHAPTIAAPIADQLAPEDAAFSFVLPAGTFADTDAGDTLTYTATLSSGAALPSWLSFNTTTRTFSGTPLQANVGSITVRVTANDGNGGTISDDFVITTANVNDAPIVAAPITDRTASEDSPFSFVVPAGAFTDQDGDALTYSATLSAGAALPSWLSFNATTRTFSGTPGAGDVGPITVRVSVSDGNTGTAFDDFVITTGSVNHAPLVANPIADQAAPEDAVFSFVVPANSFADSDASDVLTYSAALSSGAALPSWLTFNAATRTFSGTPLQANVGAITVRVTANDGHGGTISDDFVITTANVNDAPIVAIAIPDRTANQGAAFSYVVPAGTFTDQDGDALTYSATLSSGAALPAWLTFNATTRTFGGTPAAGDVGSITVRVTANDGASGSAFDEFVIATSAAPSNNPPVVAAPLADRAATEGTALSFTLPANSFTDPNGDTLTYTATLSSGAALPSWLTFNATTRAFSGTAGAGAMGTLTVRVTANDGKGGTVFDDFDIVVSPVAINGTTANNTLTDNATYDNIINALAGDDTINVTAGTDGDRVLGGDGTDTVNFTGFTAATTYTIAVATIAGVAHVAVDAPGTGVVDLATADVEFLNLNGGANADIFNSSGQLFDGGVWIFRANGNGGADRFVGGQVDDWFYGGDGDDIFYGAEGDNIFDGGNGLDTADYSAVTVTTYGWVQGTTFYMTHDGWGTDNLFNVEKIILGQADDFFTSSATLVHVVAGAGNDLFADGAGVANTFEGGLGNDTMDGAGGVDVLIGNQGADNLTGGAGADRFVYLLTSDSILGAADTIGDFATASDKIDLSAIDANSGVAGDQAFAFVTTHVGAGDLTVTANGAGSWLVSIFTDADATADMIINVSGSQPLASDFIL